MTQEVTNNGKDKICQGGGQALLWAISLALVVIAAWLAVSCGNSENGPAAVSWSPELPG